MKRNKKKQIDSLGLAGIIKGESGKYSISFVISNEKKGTALLDSEFLYAAMSELFLGLKDVSFQFLIRNVSIEKEVFLEKIKLNLDKDEKTNVVIDNYNKVLEKNVDIGHNNYKTDVILTISSSYPTNQSAIKEFESLEEVIKEKVSDISGFRAKRMCVEEREELLNSLKLKQISSKERNYLKADNRLIRLFFINSFPAENGDTILSDLISVSNNVVLAINYQPLDSYIGYQAALRQISENTEIKEIPIRRTIEDRKLKRTTTAEEVIKENENDNFVRSVVRNLKECAAKSEPLLQCSFIIGLFADTLEDLDRDTKQLKISASKYSIQLRTCDYMQNKAYASILPLAETKIDVSRVFSISRISKLLPVNVNISSNKPSLEGLNSINDNMLLLDRSRYNSSFISGVGSQSYAIRRDAVNTLMTTDDSVVILTSDTSSYERLASSIDCKVFSGVSPDLFEKDEDYGILMEYKKARALYLEAFICAFDERKLLREERKAYFGKIEENAGLINEMVDFDMALSYLDLNPDRCEIFRNAVRDYKVSTMPAFESRLSIIECQTFASMITSLDYAFNLAITMKKKSKNLWIYVDGIDKFLRYEPTANYLSSIIDRCERLKVSLVLSMNDAVSVIADDDASIELDYLIRKISFFKLFSMGPIERKYFTKRLNIPKILVDYITDKEPKEGIIISPSLNVAFTDHFESDDDPFFEVVN